MACSLKPGAALMDLANLNAFIAIAETGSFSEAGERLHLTLSLIHILSIFYR